MAGEDPDYSIRDLYNAIESKNFPSWTLYIQVMTFEQAETSEFDPFDLTKVGAAISGEDHFLVPRSLYGSLQNKIVKNIKTITNSQAYIPR